MIDADRPGQVWEELPDAMVVKSRKRRFQRGPGRPLAALPTTRSVLVWAPPVPRRKISLFPKSRILFNRLGYGRATSWARFELPGRQVVKSFGVARARFDGWRPQRGSPRPGLRG